MDLGFKNQKSRNKNRHAWDTTCAIFQAKQATLFFLAQFCPKMDLGLKIEKANVGIRISILKIPCVPILTKMDNFYFFDPNMPKNGFRVGNSED